MRGQFDRQNRYPIHHLGYDCYDNVAISGGVTINNITNVTNVTNVQVNGHRPHKRWSDGENKAHSKPRHLKHRERKPELLRFFGSCGLLDSDKARRRIDNGTLTDGTVDVLRYTNRDLSKNVRGIAQGVGQISGAVGRAIGGIFGFVVRTLK